MMVGVSIGKDQLEQIAHRTIKDANGDIDDAINFEEFKKVRWGAIKALSAMSWLLSVLTKTENL